MKRPHNPRAINSIRPLPFNSNGKTPMFRRLDGREMRRAIRELSIALLAIGLLALAGIKVARGHDATDWIARGGYKSLIGELCCGERDCAALEDGDVKITAAGYFIVSLKETVPFHETLPLPAEGGGRYWRCYWGGKRKCFFAPTSGS